MQDVEVSSEFCGEEPFDKKFPDNAHAMDKEKIVCSSTAFRVVGKPI
jgi:hypothetical protein